MSRNEIAAGASMGGAGLMAVCSCGTATGTVALLGVAGIAAANPMVHPFFLGTGAALLLWGLWQRSRRAAAWAAAGVGLIAGGALLAPASVMTGDGFPHPPAHLVGFALYLAGAALIVVGFLTAYRPPKAGAAAGAGMAFAAGCTCCMATGSLVGIVGTFGLGLPWLYEMEIVFFAAMALVTYGLYRMAGWRAAWLAPAGALVLWGGPEILRALWEEMPLFGVNMRFLPAYLVSLAGIGLVFAGFVRAYRLAAGEAVRETLPGPPPEMVPEAAGVAGD